MEGDKRTGATAHVLCAGNQSGGLPSSHTRVSVGAGLGVGLTEVWVDTFPESWSDSGPSGSAMNCESYLLKAPRRLLSFP